MELSIHFQNTYSRLPERFFSRTSPHAVQAPALFKLNTALAEQLGLDADQLRTEAGISVLAGNSVPNGAEPLAMAYAGHQFGNWVPQLGDGRAVLLGEVLDRDGVRFDLQLKGSGRTPYSRMGDGRAVLGPVLREYLVSEAMWALGIPTTRALAAVTTGEKVIREGIMPGAVLTRVAKMHVRVGTFQFFAARQDVDGLKQLANYVIERCYPHLADTPNPYRGLLDAVIVAQAKLIARWMSVGFIHGVMNTDNMSISGETIDFGPCAFMDDYHPERVFSSIDHTGRYAFGRQPDMGHWNLACLARALLPLLDDDQEKAVQQGQDAIDAYPDIFADEWREVATSKLGLQLQAEGAVELFHDLLKLMAAREADYTNTFRKLSLNPTHMNFLDGMSDADTDLSAWWSRYKVLCDADPRPVSERAREMQKTNPAFIPRNHRVEEVIAAAYGGDIAPFNRLVEILKNPFEEQQAHEEFKRPPTPQEVVSATFCGT